MMKLQMTGQFKKDLKRYKHANEMLKDLETVLIHLRENGVIPNKYRPHQLYGNYKDCMECHVHGDFLLIWFDKNKPIIKLLRLGSHSELFK
mgnify:FL=1